MNQCTFLGRLTADPEIRYAQETQKPIARFTVAVDRWRTEDGEQNADFFPCVVFNQRAEFAEKYLRRGMRILVSGSMRNNHYTNRNGEKVYGTELLGNLIEFADGKGETEANGGQEQSAGRSGQNQTGAAGTRTSAGMGNTAAGNAGAGAAAGGRTSTASGQSAAPSQRTASGQTVSRQSATFSQAAPRQRTAPSQAAGRQQAASRQSAAGTTSSRSQAGRAAASRQPARTTAASQGGGFMNIPDGIDDELPFR